MRLDQSKRCVGVTCYIKNSIAYSYKDSFCSNTKSVFFWHFLPKSKPILLRILYRPSDKQDFVNHINVFIKTGVWNKQECYLPGELNINLILDKKEIFSNKSCKINSQNLPPLTKGLSRLLLLLFPGTTNFYTFYIFYTFIDHVLTNSSQKASQCGAIELGIFHHNLVYCTRKTPLLKLNKHNEAIISSLKTCTKEKFVELLRKTDFPEYTNCTCLNKAYQDLIFKLSDVIDLLCPSKKLR